MNVLDRRLELLDMEGNGFSRPVIVKHLSVKHQCTERTVWYDFAKKPKWQPTIQQLADDQVLMKVLNRYNSIYQKAAFSALQAHDWKEQHSALRIMNDANSKYYETALPNRASIKTEMMLTQREPFVIEMWRPQLAETTE